MMNIGDIVFALHESNKMWPAKIVAIANYYEVQFYGIKTPKKIQLHQALPFTIELAEKYELKKYKRLGTAIKSALKEFHTQLQPKETNLQQEDEGKGEASNKKYSLHQIKEEEEDCKQEEEQEMRERQKSMYVEYELFHEYLTGLNELAVIQDCKENIAKEYSFFCSRTKSQTTYLRTPKYILVILFNQLLFLSCVRKDRKLRARYQKKSRNIMNSNSITLQDCLNSKIMKMVSFSQRHRQRTELSQEEDQYFSVVAEFSRNMITQLQLYLKDYSDVARLAEMLQALHFCQPEK